MSSERVDYADLHLARKADQMKLRRRIQMAATHVCSFDGFLDTACVDVTTVDGLNQARRLIDGNTAVGSAAAALIISAPAR